MTGQPRDQRVAGEAKQDRLLRVFGWARAAIVWERLWRNIWPLLAVSAIFVSVALFDILPYFSFWVHWVILAGFFGLFATRLWVIAHARYRVDEPEVRRRIEADNGLAHRPLTTLDDRLMNEAAGSHGEAMASEAIWQAHQARALRQLTKIKAIAPRPGLAKRDLFGLRFAVLLLFVIALISANGQVQDRLARALLPTQALAQSTAVDFDLWITPPSYTGLAPLFLEKPTVGPSDPGAKKAETAGTDANLGPELIIPVDSSVLVQISGADDVPELRIGSRTLAVGRLGADTGGRDFRLEDVFVDDDQSAARIALRVGGEILAEWPVKIVRDGPPTAEFTEPPKRTRKASLNLQFEATDDFSVKDVWAEISLPGEPQSQVDDNRIRFDLTASGFGTKIAKGRGERDFSAHRWAGIPVQIRVHAKDSAGQVGSSDPLETVLPARTFNHPVARALVEIRKDLNRPSPDVVEQSTETLLGLLQRPVHFFHDTIVFLAISVARSRLTNNQTADSIGSVQDLLWETALRLEDGEFSIAERQLKEIQERLAKAMQENAPTEELERLMDELQQALNKYMQALAEHMERQGLSQMPMDLDARTLETMDLQSMVDRARELAKTGAMDAAKQMLSQLNRMLEGLRNGAAMARQNPAMAKARKMMNAMRSLAQRQQQLMDQTFRRSQTNPDGQQNRNENPSQAQPSERQQREARQRRNQPGQTGKPGQGEPQSAEAMRQQQEALRRELGRLMLQMDEALGSIPPGLGEAERSMKGAGKSLGKGDATGAVPQQADALEKLRQGMESAAEQMAQRMQGRSIGVGIGMMPGSQGNGQRQGSERDPFGRQNGNGQFGNVNDDNGIKVPTEREIFRAREIMEELHRRSEESDRKEPERDYIDRLLRRF